MAACVTSISAERPGDASGAGIHGCVGAIRRTKYGEENGKLKASRTKEVLR
jgi:hypothetical protein